MMNDNNFASIPPVPSVPTIQQTGSIGVPIIFPDGFSLPLKETPTELLDIIARDFPDRSYRVSAPYPIREFSRVSIELASPMRPYAYGRILYQDKKVKFNYSCKSPFSYTYSNVVLPTTIHVEYVWKKDEFTARADLPLPVSRYRRGRVRIMVSRKKRGEKYSIEIPDNYLPIGYWKEGIPCVSSQYKYDKTVFKVPSNCPNTVIQEIAPQFRFPFPISFCPGDHITSLIDNIPDTHMNSVYDYALQAGVFPVQKQLRHRTQICWST